MVDVVRASLLNKMKTSAEKKNDLTKQIFLVKNKMEVEKEKMDNGLNNLYLQSRNISDMNLDLASLSSRKKEEIEFEEGCIGILHGFETVSKHYQDTVNRKQYEVQIETKTLESLNSNLDAKRIRIEELKEGFENSCFLNFV